MRFLFQSRVLLICSVAALCGLLFGYDTGIISGALLFLQSDFHLTPSSTGILVSMVPFGALFGALISSRMADLFGRRRMLLLDATLFLVGTLISSVAITEHTLILGRFIVGLAVGIASYISPLYISEIAPTKIRGTLVTLHQVFMAFGFLLCNLIGFLLSKEGNWQGMFATGLIPAGLLFIGALFLPESPRWLVFKGREAEATRVLNKIYDNDEIAVQVTLRNCRVVSQHDRNWKRLFSPALRPTLLTAMGLVVFQQIVGINAILYYAPKIFLIAGFQTAHSSLFATLGLGFAGFLFTVAALPFVDTVGRRKMLLIGLVGMSISLACLSFSFYVGGATPWVKWITFASLLLYLMNFAFSMGPLVWVLLSEIFPLSVRGLACGLATGLHWTTDMLVSAVFLSLIAVLGASGTFFMFLILNICCFIFTYYRVYETKQISLEELEENLISDKTRAPKHGSLLNPVS